MKIYPFEISFESNTDNGELVQVIVEYTLSNQYGFDYRKISAFKESPLTKIELSVKEDHRFAMEAHPLIWDEIKAGGVA